MTAARITALAVVTLLTLAGCGAASSSSAAPTAQGAAAAATSSGNTDAGRYGGYGYGAPEESTAAPGAPASTATVATGSTSLGIFLVDARGRTLYLFEADTAGRPTCMGSCAANWPPLTAAGAAVAGPGVDQHLLTTVAGANGTMQVAYNGHPLYTFVADHAAGDTRGEGVTAFGAQWYVVAPSGAKIDNG